MKTSWEVLGVEETIRRHEARLADVKKALAIHKAQQKPDEGAIAYCLEEIATMEKLIAHGKKLQEEGK